MEKLLDLENHISITSASVIDNITRPLRDALDIKFFRYLKLYKNGNRVLLSNIPDAIRYMYGQGQYVHMWYDGEFPEFLREGWYNWHLNSLLHKKPEKTNIESDVTSLLKVKHGITRVQEGEQFFEFFSFDTIDKNIYKVNNSLLQRFIYYFKDQAKKLIHIAENESFLIPIKNIQTMSKIPDNLKFFLKETKINRYYLGGKYEDAYLTKKEMMCVRWMLEGKTAEEIGIIESIHPKTVQRHIENIKLKFNCSKQTQLIQLILNSGLGENEFLV